MIILIISRPGLTTSGCLRKDFIESDILQGEIKEATSELVFASVHS